MVLVGRDGKVPQEVAKQVRSTGRELSRLIVLEVKQREMKLVIDWLVDQLVHCFFHSIVLSFIQSHMHECTS